MRMNVEYNDAAKSVKTVTQDLSPEEQAMNTTNGSAGHMEDESGSKRRPGCEGYVHVNESDAW